MVVMEIQVDWIRSSGKRAAEGCPICEYQLNGEETSGMKLNSCGFNLERD